MLSRATWELGRSFRPSAVSGESALKAARGDSLGFRAVARLVWEVMTARDRYRDYVRARRLASNGAIVISIADDADGHVAVTIADQGPGVAEVDRGRLLVVVRAHPSDAGAVIDAFGRNCGCVRVPPDV